MSTLYAKRLQVFNCNFIPDYEANGKDQHPDHHSCSDSHPYNKVHIRCQPCWFGTNRFRVFGIRDCSILCLCSKLDSEI